MAPMNLQNETKKKYRVSGYRGMILSGTILLASIIIVFFVLIKLEGSIFHDEKKTAQNAVLKNIFVVLLENYEKRLLDEKMKLLEDKKILMSRMNSAGSEELKMIRNRINEIEKREKDASAKLENAKNEKQALAAELNRKSGLVENLTVERDNLTQEILFIKNDWASYTDSIKNELLLHAAGPDEKQKIDRAFSKDYGRNDFKEIIDMLVKNHPFNDHPDTAIDAEIEKLKAEKSGLEKKLREVLDKKASLAGQKDKELKKLLDEIERLKTEKKELSMITEKKGSLHSTAPDPGIDENELKKLREETAKLKTENERLGNMIKTKQQAADMIETKGSMNEELQALMNINGINGFFIADGKKTIVVFNRKKLAGSFKSEIFDVYDIDGKPATRIYLNLNGDKINMTRLPGYADPKPGDWF